MNPYVRPLILYALLFSPVWVLSVALIAGILRPTMAQQLRRALLAIASLTVIVAWTFLPAAKNALREPFLRLRPGSDTDTFSARWVALPGC